MYLCGTSVKETKKKGLKRKGYLLQMRSSPVTVPCLLAASLLEASLKVWPVDEFFRYRTSGLLVRAGF